MEKVVEVPVHQVVEVPKVVEKTVEVQKLVVDKAAQLQLQYANEDIEFLKRELAAAKAASYRYGGFRNLRSACYGHVLMYVFLLMQHT